MKIDYNKILDLMKTSGERLVAKAGNVADIGVRKINLTEEDIAIERGFKEIIESLDGEHVLYAEEENDVCKKAENVWVADPISGTKNFIQGTLHYAIVIAHVVDGTTVFAAAYDPSVDEFYVAYLHKGATLNGASIHPSARASKVIFRPSSQWGDSAMIEKVQHALSGYEVESNTYSMAVNYCAVASGQSDGIISLTKDSFPEFAGAFIVQEAGGRFTNLAGNSHISASDRIFVAGNTSMYDELFPIMQNIVN